MAVRRKTISPFKPSNIFDFYLVLISTVFSPAAGMGKVVAGLRASPTKNGKSPNRPKNSSSHILQSRYLYRRDEITMILTMFLLLQQASDCVRIGSRNKDARHATATDCGRVSSRCPSTCLRSHTVTFNDIPEEAYVGTTQGASLSS